MLKPFDRSLSGKVDDNGEQSSRLHTSGPLPGLLEVVPVGSGAHSSCSVSTFVLDGLATHFCTVAETATPVSVESHLEEAYWRFVDTGGEPYLAGQSIISGLQLTFFKTEKCQRFNGYEGVLF